jgi:(p)ppGpp synthase/HD superfamily hydrolase
MKKGEMLANMLLVATNAHGGQFDRGGQPYILHPLKVMHYLKSDDEELLCIALGHDIVEDTPTTFKQLRAVGMSERVVRAIRALTKMPGQTYDEYRSKVMENPDAIRVKMADLRHNCDIRRLKGLTDADFARTERYHRFYVDLQDALTAHEHGFYYDDGPTRRYVDELPF